MGHDPPSERSVPGNGAEGDDSLHLREQRFHSAADTFPHAYVVYDPDLRVRFINQAGIARSGLAREQILGRRDEEIFPRSVTDSYLPQLLRCRDSRQTRTFESTHTLPMAPGAGPTTILISYIPVVDRAGKLRQIIGVTFDITERKQAEERLRQSENRLAAAVGVAQLGIWEFDVKAGRIRFDERCRQIFGLASDASLSVPDFLSLVHPEDRGPVAEQVQRASAPGSFGIYETEYRAIRRDGAQIWVAARGHSVGGTEPDAEPSNLVGTLMDITERKLAELERDRFFDLSLDLLGTVSLRDARWVRINPGFVRVLGWSEQEVLAVLFLDLVHPADLSRTREATAELAAGEPLLMFEQRMRCKDGDYRWIAWNIAPYPAEDLMYCVGRDVTEPKRAEEELRAREAEASARAAELAALMDVVPAITFIAYDQSCLRMESNRSARRLLRLPEGANPSASAGEGDAPAYHPYGEDRELQPHELPVQVAAATGREVRDAELSLVFPDGTRRDIMGNAVPLFDAEGRPRGAVGAFIDITEHKQAEARLKESEAKYRNLFQNMAEEVHYWEVVRDGRGEIETWRLIDANPPALQNWGKTLEEVRGRTADEVIGPGATAHYLEIVRRIMSERVPHSYEDYFPGLDKHCRLTSVPLGDHFITTGADITEVKKAGEALRRSKDELERFTRTLEDRVRQRTAEIEQRAVQLRQLHSELARAEQKERRQLAATLHDGLQQLLVAARLRLGPARDRAGPAALPVLAEIEDLLAQSIEASRSLTVELSPPVLHERGLIAALQWLARQMLEKQNLKVRVLAAEDVEPPSEDLRLLLFQAARELLFNVAKHAEAQEAIVALRQEDGRLRLEVLDTGKGFDSRRLGEPDFRASSFGLFNLQQRLEWVSGTLEIESAPGRGTRVRLHVPLQEQPAAPPVAAASPTGVVYLRPQPLAGSTAGRRQRILLADDHEIVREGLISLLERCPDLEVVAQAADGLAAVEMTRRHRPDVVIMDMSMPGIDGIEATRRIAAELPRTRIIGLSMHESADFAEAMHEAGAVGYLRKDGPLDDLVTLIRRDEPPRD